MEQTDFLMRQINKMTDLLKKLLSNILNIKDQDPTACFDLIQTELKDIIGIGINDIVKISDEDFIKIIDSKNVSKAGKEYLAEIIEISSDLIDKSEKNILLMKTLLIYENISKLNSNNFSIELYTKSENILKKLKK